MIIFSTSYKNISFWSFYLNIHSLKPNVEHSKDSTDQIARELEIDLLSFILEPKGDSLMHFKVPKWQHYFEFWCQKFGIEWEFGLNKNGNPNFIENPNHFFCWKIHKRRKSLSMFGHVSKVLSYISYYSKNNHWCWSYIG